MRVTKSTDGLKEDDKGLTVQIGIPKWLKTMWSTTAGSWFKYDDGYSILFKVIGFLVLAPVAGFFAALAHSIPAPAIFSVAAMMLFILFCVGMFSIDDGPTAKETFWRWMTATVVFYLMAGIGILEIFAIQAMVVVP